VARLIRDFLGLSPEPGATWREHARHIALQVFRAVLIGYAVTAMLLYALQSRMLYFPQREVDSTPADIGMDYEQASLTASDGTRISAWWIPAENPKATVLFCHGNAGNISHRLGTLSIFNRLAFSTLIFDYRGYGSSEGKPTERGTYLDAEAAWRFLTGEKGIAPDNIVIYGRSLGGAVAAHLAADVAPAALVVDSSFTSVPDRASEMLPIFPVRLVCKFRYDTRECLKRAGRPVMVIHSRDDEMMPFKHAKDLYESAGEPKQLLERQGSHNDGFATSPGEVLTELGKFVARSVGKPGTDGSR